MNALTIAVAVLFAAVTVSAVEVTPNSYGSYKHPSTCRSAEPFGAMTLDRPDSDGEGCTCTGSWQPHCCCPRPRLHSLPPCTRTCTCRLPSCSGPPATKPAPYQTAGYSPWPTASTSWPDLPCSDPSPGPSPCPAAAAAVPAPAPAPLCTACCSSPFPRPADQPPCRYCARLPQPSCPSGVSPPSVSGPSPSDLAEFMSPPQRPMLPKLIPVVLKPLSFNDQRPSAPCGPGLGYGGSVLSLPSPYGCGCPPSPYEYYNNK